MRVPDGWPPLISPLWRLEDRIRLTGRLIHLKALACENAHHRMFLWHYCGIIPNDQLRLVGDGNRRSASILAIGTASASAEHTDDD